MPYVFLSDIGKFVEDVGSFPEIWRMAELQFIPILHIRIFIADAEQAFIKISDCVDFLTLEQNV